VARTFHPLRISNIRRETADAVSLALDVPEHLLDTFKFTPGQFLTFRVDGPDGQPLDRSYSICSTPQDGELRVLVKRLPGGVFGERAHTRMAVGDIIDTLPPLGRFTVPIDAANAKRYLAIAAGSGISPEISLIRAILATEPASQVTLLYGNRGGGSTIFRDLLADLKDRYLARLQVIYLFSREGQTTELLNGRLTTQKLKELGAALLDIDGYDDAFVCGPEPMTLELRQALIDLGLPPDHVHVELFGSHAVKPSQKLGPGNTAPVRLDVIVAGIRRTIDGERNQTVLEAARAAGLDVPFSCTGGVCATCRARLVDGEVTMAVNYSLQQWELDAGFVLTCQSLPTTPTVAIDYDAV
jgi:ring-1,2-phenylacetyl-CoA epoxidase subunit PaaE